MGSAAEPTAGPERMIFWVAAAAVVVLDLVTKIIAEATLLRTPGIAVLGDWFHCAWSTIRAPRSGFISARTPAGSS